MREDKAGAQAASSAIAGRLVGLVFCLPLVISPTIIGQDAGRYADNLRQSGKLAMSPEARARVRQQVAAVGLVMARNANDPAGQGPRPRGSAVIVRRDGIVVTSYHVIANIRTDRLYDEVFLSLPPDGMAAMAATNRYRLEPLLLSKQYDLALLRIATNSASPGAFPAIELGDSHKVDALDDLIFIGFPEKGGSTVTVNAGQVEGKDILEHWIKTSGRLIHGNSGGAAVNTDGKLIGIATKVLVDRQPVDNDRDGFPDAYREYGSIGFLRPAHLIGEMLAQLRDAEQKGRTAAAVNGNRTIVTEPAPRVAVKGIIKSSVTGGPVAGARVGLVPLGSREVTAENLLTWGGTNGDGEFELNRPVPPGRYSLRVKAIGYADFNQDVEVTRQMARLVIQLRAP